MKNLGIGTGRRKTAVARVCVRMGNGNVTVNRRDVGAYFPTAEQLRRVREPLFATANERRYDVIVNVYGGGLDGQAGACAHGIARALVRADASNQASLRAGGLLTRDSRMVERKKYGQRGARRRFQFSKR
ncbi:30S ribosomal protein S9 [Treponema pallidum]|uniref:Small ribosomal subunit protein uS9 n=2 Tax=Treponema pallidum TaxID=160 RepID=A0AAU8S2V4_TREPL|nr:30S ribosomal protein S9 [Treponema pallidum]AEZ58168.1 ribosomal protein S9 [Treponema pallidum subsp. pertenue str. SamoaD]AEZ59236.1 ribosomal protein S9 [Treponema pallidum subsp. pertenue str. CDC2]AEZ60304.1 ribosomal protein S9 [Treponema pallidum subsp. pertenue str. Gauthier]AGK84687.1 ribosomal protein S9 [Treponema pallidum str. Fribourg-Blanc]AJB41064.1 ribosomal protein S9 [Treponema pallidum subsp. endemicum str. Bosnia A]